MADTAFESRTFGRTDLALSRLGLGGHTFRGRFGGRDRPDEDTLYRIVELCLDRGINLFDAGEGEECECFGRVLGRLGIRGRIHISSMGLGSRMMTRAAAVEKVERVLEQLRIERLDLFYINQPCTEEHLGAFAHLKARGMIRRAGLFGCELAKATPSEEIDFVMDRYNYYHQHNAEAWAALKARGLGTISVEPLGRGRFLQEVPQDSERIARALMRFVCANQSIDATLVSMHTVAQVEANAAAARSADPPGGEDLELLERGRGYEIPFDPWH